MPEQKSFELALQKSIDTASAERDIAPWESQDTILENTGICREGGITNLGVVVGLDSAYEETFYAANGSKVQLKRDTINKSFQVFSDSRNIGIIPYWGVKARGVVPSNVADVMATIDDTLLFLYFVQGIATIEEVEIETLARLNVRSFLIPSGLAQIAFVRNKQPTYANVLSIVGYSSAPSATNRVLTAYIMDDSGTLFSVTVTAPAGADPVSLVCHYDHGWLLEVDVWTDAATTNNLWMIKTDLSATKILGSINTKGLIADYDLSTGDATYKTFIDRAASSSLDFVAAGIAGLHWYNITCDKDGNMWACVFGGDIYKRLAGSSTFSAIGGTSRNWDGICADPVTGDIWACVLSGDIYRCPYGSTTFTGVGGTSRQWTGIAIDSGGDKWACVNPGDIYRAASGSSTFTAIGGTSRAWTGIAANPVTGDKWGAVYSGDIYKCSSGLSAFTAIGGTSRNWLSIGSDSVGNIWAGISGGDIYRSVSGTSAFTKILASSHVTQGFSGDINGNVWIAVDSDNLYVYSAPYYYGYIFTPPASDGLAWTLAPQMDNSIGGTISKRNITFGGFALANNTSYLSFYNWSSVRSWNIFQPETPEIYGDLWPSLTDFALKTHTIGGVGSYLSASFDPDGIGAPITEIGEISPYYAPQAIQIDSNNYLIVYQRGDGGFGYIYISSEEFSRMSEIKPGIIKMNCASGLNIADTLMSDLKMGGNAYNGFAIIGFESLATMGAWAARHRGDYGGSVDTGYKNNTAIAAGNVTFVIIPEAVQFSPNNELIDIFIGLPPSSLNYYQSIMSGYGAAYDPKLVGTIYVDDQILPIPAGSEISERSVILSLTTALREQDYDGYQLGNELAGTYNSFVLYGGVYFVDPDWIWAISVSAGNTISDARKNVPVRGLRFITASPTEAYFISSFDNSLFSFNGGQSVNKQALFNRRNPIVGGIYSVIENTLALIADSSVIFIRDGIISETPLSFTTPPDLYSTVDGIWLSRDGYSLRYVFSGAIGVSPTPVDVIDGGAWGTVYADTLDGGSWGDTLDTIDGGTWGDALATISPLVWASKFLGVSDKRIQRIDRFLFRVYKEDLAETEITIKFSYFDEQSQVEETRLYTLGSVSHPYDSKGYCYFEYIPRQKRNIANSIKIEAAEKILLLSAIGTVADDGDTVVINR